MRKRYMKKRSTKRGSRRTTKRMRRSGNKLPRFSGKVGYRL